jgi:hypothetical protein
LFGRNADDNLAIDNIPADRNTSFRSHVLRRAFARNKWQDENKTEKSDDGPGHLISVVTSLAVGRWLLWPVEQPLLA